MKNLFGSKSDPELQARDAIRRRKWSRAIAHYERKLQENERDFALWNLLGDLHMNNRSRAQAVEAWRHALEGYALEGLHENVLGLARKMLRRTPEEEDVHLIMAEACLGLEYHADCLSAMRTYLKIAKRRSESDLRSLFKKVLDAGVRHAHLLEELQAIYRESGIEDIELQRRLEEHVAGSLKPVRPESGPESTDETVSGAVPETGIRHEPAAHEGLMTLDGIESFGGDSSDFSLDDGATLRRSEPPELPDFRAPAAVEPEAIPDGEGKDHYDLGMVYREMKLWDAAIAEFEQARRDPSLRVRATLALAECLQESHDLQGALDLLETERESGTITPQDQITVRHRLGMIHELLGNLDEALGHFEAVSAAQPGYGDVETRISELRTRRTDAPANE